MRLSNSDTLTTPFGPEFATVFQDRKREADEFYQAVTPFPLSEDRGSGKTDPAVGRICRPRSDSPTPGATPRGELMGGGTSVNTIAPRATALLDVRSTDIIALDRVAGEVRTIVEQRAGPGLQTEIEVLGERPAGERSQSDPLVQLAAAAITWIGLAPKYQASSTDANIPISLHIPAVCIGITQVARSHTREEFLSVTPIGDGLAQLTRLCIEACTLIVH